MKAWEWEFAAAFLAGGVLILAPAAYLWNADSAVARQVPRDAVTAAAVGGSLVAGGLCLVAAALLRRGKSDRPGG